MEEVKKSSDTGAKVIVLSESTSGIEGYLTLFNSTVNASVMQEEKRYSSRSADLI